MEARHLIVFFFACLFCFASMAAAVPGLATFYTHLIFLHRASASKTGVMIAAASDAIWDNTAACGRRYSVTCTGPTNAGVPQPCRGTSVVVTIVGYCPAGCRGTIDLSQEAFNTIADPNASVVKIDYRQV